MPACNVYVFGSNEVVTPFLQCYKSAKKPQVIFDKEKYNLKLHQDLKPTNANFFGTKKTILLSDVTLVLFSVLDLDSFNFVRKQWLNSKIKIFSPNTPTILVGCNTDYRIKTEEAKKSTSLKKKQISSKIGEHLLRSVNASKYLECSAIDETNLQSIFEETVQTSIRYKYITLSFDVAIIGNNNCGKTEMIRRLVGDERLNVLGECLNDQLPFSKDDEDVFSTYIEIDSEEFHLIFQNYSSDMITSAIQQKLFNFTNVLGKNSDFGRMFDLFIVLFSVIEPDLSNMVLVTKTFLQCAQMFYDYQEFPLPFIVVGYQTNLRNDPEILKILREQGKSPLTCEKGEQLARDLGATSYLECSSSNINEIKFFFEEAVWAAIRNRENRYHPIVQEKARQKQGFFKRLLSRWF